MPGRNGIGPMGVGPGTGWGRGPCGGGGRWGARGAGHGGGYGGGYGGGRGQGCGRGAGFGRGMWGLAETGWSERRLLENEEARLREQLEAVRSRLGELREDPREAAE